MKGLFTGRIIRTQRLSPSSHLVVFERPRGFPDVAPGQFISLRITSTITPLLRRPFSIMDLTGTELHLLVKVVGKGSDILAHSQCGAEMDIAGPLGDTAFSSPGKKDAVFVAGGTGLAPMIFETSRQARFMIPMAISLGYGIVFATLITLVLVPSLYLLVEDGQAGVARVMARLRSRGSSDAETASA